MIERLLVKDYKNTGDPQVRARYGTAAGLFGIATNLILFALKLTIGLLSGSITIVAEAVNNLSDAASSVLTMIGFRLSNRPADKDHPFGHARYEQITAFIVALFVLSIGVLFAKSSVDKIISPGELTISPATIAVLVAAVIIKLWQMVTYRRMAGLIDSMALRATAMDSRNDAISTLSVLFSMVLMKLFDVNLDGYVGLLVSVFVIISAIGMVRSSLGPMLGEPPTKEQVDAICSLIDGNEDILGRHDLIIHSYGAGAAFASIHIEFDAKKDIIKIHDLVDNIEREAYSKLGISLTVHMDPVDVSNPLRHKLYELTAAGLHKFDPELRFHDFRLVDGPTHTNVLFDIVEPFGKSYDLDKLRELLSKEISSVEGRFYFVINVDKKLD